MESVIKLLTRLGFFINFEKASLIPNTSMRFLGFILDSVEMVLKPPEDKVTKALHLIQTFLEFKTFKIREVASLIGVVNHLSHDVDYGKAHIKGLGNDKIDALRSAGEKGFEGGMNISENGVHDLFWWLNNLEGSCRVISLSVPGIVFETVASKIGWGAVSRSRTVNGRWDTQERELHTNALETLAVFKAMQTLFPNTYNTHFKLMSDNTTTIAYVNKAGGTWSKICNDVAKQIWELCQKKKQLLDQCHVYPGER